MSDLRLVNMDAVRDGTDPLIPAVATVTVDLDQFNTASDALMDDWVGRAMIQCEMLHEYINYIIKKEMSQIDSSVAVLKQTSVDSGIIDDVAAAAALGGLETNSVSLGG